VVGREEGGKGHEAAPTHKFIGVSKSGRARNGTRDMAWLRKCQSSNMTSHQCARGVEANAEGVGRFIISSECHVTHMTPPERRGIQSERRAIPRRREKEVTSSTDDQD
jgi:hypothetical protein